MLTWIDTLAPKAKKIYTLMDDVRYFSKANPYAFTLFNSDIVALPFQIFGSGGFRTQPNLGNNLKIQLTYDYPDYDYVSMNASTENQNINIGKIRIESTNIANLNTPITAIYYSSTGEQEQNPNVFFRRLNQYQSDAVEFETSILVNSDTLLKGMIQPNTGMKFLLYFDHYTSFKLLLNEGYLAKETALSSPPTTPNEDVNYMPQKIAIGDRIY